MIHPYDALTVLSPSANHLLLTPCPGTRGTSTLTALETLQQAGASAVLTLLPASELAQLQVNDLGHCCARLGLAWFHCPIGDDQAPAHEFFTAWQQQRTAIMALLDRGQTLAIHCKMGSGRTGLIAAQILIERGVSAADAYQQVKALRPHAITAPSHQQYFQTLSPMAGEHGSQAHLSLTNSGLANSDNDDSNQ